MGNQLGLQHVNFEYLKYVAPISLFICALVVMLFQFANENYLEKNKTIF